MYLAHRLNNNKVIIIKSMIWPRRNQSSIGFNQHLLLPAANMVQFAPQKSGMNLVITLMLLIGVFLVTASFGGRKNPQNWDGGM